MGVENEHGTSLDASDPLPLLLIVQQLRSMLLSRLSCSIALILSFSSHNERLKHE
jgi:hypothetical protein